VLRLCVRLCKVVKDIGTGLVERNLLIRYISVLYPHFLNKIKKHYFV